MIKLPPGTSTGRVLQFWVRCVDDQYIHLLYNIWRRLFVVPFPLLSLIALAFQLSTSRWHYQAPSPNIIIINVHQNVKIGKLYELTSTSLPAWDTQCTRSVDGRCRTNHYGGNAAVDISTVPVEDSCNRVELYLNHCNKMFLTLIIF